MIHVEWLTVFRFQICKNDPLPNRICIQCQQDVNVLHYKLFRFQALEKKLYQKVKRRNPDHPYLKLVDFYEVSLLANQLSARHGISN